MDIQADRRTLGKHGRLPGNADFPSRYPPQDEPRQPPAHHRRTARKPRSPANCRPTALHTVYITLGRTEQALAAARESLEIGERLESDVAIARALIELGTALRAAGEADAALDALHRALTHQARLGSERRMAAILIETAQTLADSGRTEQAAECRREAERLLASADGAGSVAAERE